MPVGLQVGYAFRPNVGQQDDRFHGAAGAVTVDAPPVVWGFSGRLELDVLAWPAQSSIDTPLLAAIVVPSLTYSFDDTGPSATASLGPAVGIVADSAVQVVAGVQAGLQLRVPLVDGFDVSARIGVGMLSATGLYATALVGLTVSPDVLFSRAQRGDGPEAIAREVAPTLLPHEEHDDDDVPAL